MRNLDVMDNSYFGIFLNTVFSLLGWTSLNENVETITDTIPSLDYLKIIVSSAAETGIDVTSKILILVLTTLSIITSCITIGQFLYKVSKNKNKQ